MPRAKKETTERKDRRDTPYISPKRVAYRKMIARVKKTEGLWGEVDGIIFEGRVKT